jgi:hypothetical protein
MVAMVRSAPGPLPELPQASRQCISEKAVVGSPRIHALQGNRHVSAPGGTPVELKSPSDAECAEGQPPDRRQ